MSQNNLPNMLSFKNAQGEWVNVPAIYQTAYQAYVAYCNSTQKTPITLAQFYNVFNILADSNFINQLLSASEETGVLPVAMGGTGAVTAEGALQNLGITIGVGEPNADTAGSIYFRIAEEVS